MFKGLGQVAKLTGTMAFGTFTAILGLTGIIYGSLVKRIECAAVSVAVTLLTALSGVSKMTACMALGTLHLAMAMQQRIGSLLVLVDVEMMGLKAILMMAGQTIAFQVGLVVKLAAMRILMALSTALGTAPRKARGEAGSQSSAMAFFTPQILVRTLQ